ncbi:phage repressor protein CI [Tatumella sp. OPLPL6]|uniref:phage repressor protein CI n=1 Tax=Tatumella sp. OPLPL6 TaxID=1928657 RepID=UPI000C197B35|nr:phage repressor protein CI [Tatumella sp. OPLPL6]PIJ41741.1 phage repressor protein [Tatumella sp. OPLPL6]
MIQIKAGENTGGRDTIHRLIAAYSFKSRQQLCDHLGVNKSTMANRYLRDSFPAEWVIQCALETNASLLWLATGQGTPEIQISPHHNQITTIKSTEKQTISSKITRLEKLRLHNGQLISEGLAVIDESLISPSSTKAILIHTQNESYLVDQAIGTLSNGYYLVDIDGTKSIANLTRLPKNRLMVQHNDSSFECAIDDINVEGRATKVFKSI